MTGTITDANHQMPELLAPAGDPATLRAAVANGADAVYLGGSAFSARQNAANFSGAEMAEAINDAHLRSSRVYLALNTLIAEDEGDAALALAAESWQMGIDAVILQDIGLARMLRRQLPDLPLHASTQMTIADEAGIRAAADLGIRRVILPRELSLAEIRQVTALARTRQMETEIFVHGALCVCYSGQCLLSSMIGGRSGNRGTCAQPCRLPWQITSHNAGKSAAGKPGACLSPRDQALINWLPQLVETGVASLKIEGRMRGAAYVAQTVAAYRDALDRLADTGSLGSDDLARPLLQAFNRGGGFTDRYISGKCQPDFLSGAPTGSHGVLLGTIASVDPRQGRLGIMPVSDWPLEQKPGRGDVLSIRRMDAEQETASAPIGEVSQIGRIFMVKGFHPEVMTQLKIGDPVYRMTDRQAEQQALRADRRRTTVDLRLTDDVALTARIASGIWQNRGLSAAVSRSAESVDPLLPARVDQQLRKTGQTPFQIREIEQQGEIRLSIAGLNDLRRQVLDDLANQMIVAGRRKMTMMTPFANHMLPTDKYSESQPGIVSAYFHRLPDDIEQIACGAGRYYIPGFGLNADQIRDAIRMIRRIEPDSQILLWLPAAMTGAAADQQHEILSEIHEWDLDGLCAGHPGLHELALAAFSQAPKIQERRRSLVADTGANIFNLETIVYYAEIGASIICPSLELSTVRLESMAKMANKLGIQLELPIYGRLRLMSSAFCPIGQNLPGCKRCQQAGESGKPALYGLIDRKQRTFPLLTHPQACSSEIFSHFLLSAPQDLISLARSSGAAVRFYFLEEQQAERRELIQQARKMMTGSDSVSIDSFTGLFRQQAETVAKRLNTETGSGHY